ncbi:hypothetical protein MXD81_35335 [Microbacteriaceae bacterium K1510]|nr:hypothetical protein [Microbacteriaceae bacterium K1510]
MWSDGGYYDASFSIHVSRRYHAKMRDYYQMLYNYTTGFNAFGASGAFVAFLGSLTTLAATLSALVALLSLFDSIFKYESKARKHEELCARFTRLAAKLETLDPTPQNLAAIRSDRLLIECDEPAGERRLIERQAACEEGRARGVAEEDLIHLRRDQRIFGYLFTYGMKHLEDQKAARDKRWAAEAAPLPELPHGLPGQARQ